MRFDAPSEKQLEQSFASLDARARQAGKPVFVKYLDLGTRIVRLVNHSPAFTPHVERQLAISLREDAPRHDATLVIWQERDMAGTALALLRPYRLDTYNKLRLQRLARRNSDIPDIAVFDETFSLHHPLIAANPKGGLLSAWNPQNATYYYSVTDLSPEEFIKHGHIFVQTLNKILKGPGSNLGHGAVVGLHGKGALVCAIGYRGKSTLAVSAMLDGFDYVSDDYLVLGKKYDDVLRAWPIYSIITLSPGVYQTMYPRLRVKFVSNNARKDKYVFNIEEYHDRFASGHPVNLCLYPRFVEDEAPSIIPGDKEKALEELVFSTVRQMGDAQDVATISRLCSFVEALPFYRFNLSRNIDKNTRCLREFLERFE